MAYRKSKARKSFEEEIEKLRIELRVAHSASVNHPKVRAHVLTSITFLSFARLEVYLEDWVTDWVDEVRRTSLCTAGNLSLETRAYHLWDQVVSAISKKFIATNDEFDVINRLATSISRDDFSIIDDSKLPRIIAGSILNKRKYPSPKNVKVLFRRLGIRDIFMELNRRSRSNQEARLESLNDLRTSIAHDGMQVGIGLKDVRDNLTHLNRMVHLMDRILYDHIVATSGTNTWPT